MSKQIVVGPEQGGLRVDVFLAGQLEPMSRNAIQRAIEQGEIRFANDSLIQKNHRTKPGECFRCTLTPPREITAKPQDIPLDVVYEDADMIALNKPRGMVVHPAPGHPEDTLVNALLHHTAGRLSGIGGALRPGILHRLDKDTSGLLLVSKTEPAHRALAAQLQDRSLTRVYQAVAIGRVGQDEGVIDKPIGRHPTDRKRMSVYAKITRDAVTRYTVLERYNGYTHLQCRLETGRTHQIRTHMASIGHPLLGDLTYGRKRPEKGLSGQCLHAKTLEFIHPISGMPVRLTTELPAYFAEALARLGPGEPVGLEW